MILTIIPLAGLDSCPLLKSVPLHALQFPYYPDVNSSSCNIYNWDSAALIRCSTELTPTRIHAVAAADAIAGPISCLTNSTHFSYLVAYRVPAYLITLDCEVISNGPIPIPMFASSDVYNFRESAERILNFSETTTQLMAFSPVTEDCTICERQGRRCAFSSQRNQTFCMHRGIIVSNHAKHHPVYTCKLYSLQSTYMNATI
ncbi:hypothetical protein PR202_gb12458 [Eleusine coracana subsp. coracana]|uniref:Wall-associated receptor kinase C-terminal domain-containing protein n=1 Tax=Eleusine coracana subsp. coracana TaxID=191504 RepID=A0AAV5EMW6_ELECO|nr:hypothetical protein QOZ80_7BG0589000 [Eleusine coracana subsp. coracana]GJN24703.1 hypothetical protein PR202_gb12458 [Eleusine coracana subsp. coracana]